MNNGHQQKSDARPIAARRAGPSSTAERAGAAPLQRLQAQINDGPGVHQLQALARQVNLPGSSGVAQRATAPAGPDTAQPNRTGLPDGLKTGIERLSGVSLDDVKVHYNSPQPAQLQALAYAQGTDIHVAPGQEKHVPHEAWHVVQQKQGRVRPTLQMAGGPPISDDAGLEREADAMGAQALQGADAPVQQQLSTSAGPQGPIVQRVMIGGRDITQASPREDVIAALNFSNLTGIRRDLSAAQLTELLAELRQRDDQDDDTIADIIEQVEEDLDDAEGNEGSENEVAIGAGEIFLSPEEQEEKRRQAADNFGWQTFPDTIGGYKKLGVHETTGENIATLVQNGPSAEKMGDGNGLGKGEGFYVTHVGQKTLYNAIKGIEYGSHFAAIYIAESAIEFRSPSEEMNNTALLDEETEGLECYYVMSGGSEIVIPVKSFHLVKAAARPEDLTDDA